MQGVIEEGSEGKWMPGMIPPMNLGSNTWNDRSLHTSTMAPSVNPFIRRHTVDATNEIGLNERAPIGLSPGFHSADTAPAQRVEKRKFLHNDRVALCLIPSIIVVVSYGGSTVAGCLIVR